MRLLKDSYYQYIASGRPLLTPGCSCRIMAQYANVFPDNSDQGIMIERKRGTRSREIVFRTSSPKLSAGSVNEEEKDECGASLSSTWVKHGERR
jgi:hypothetical protein